MRTLSQSDVNGLVAPLEKMTLHNFLEKVVLPAEILRESYEGEPGSPYFRRQDDLKGQNKLFTAPGAGMLNDIKELASAIRRRALLELALQARGEDLAVGSVGYSSTNPESLIFSREIEYALTPGAIGTVIDSHGDVTLKDYMDAVIQEAKDWRKQGSSRILDAIEKATEDSKATPPGTARGSGRS